MLRFDYTELDNGIVNVTIIEEEKDKHSLCGRINMSKKAFDTLFNIFPANGARPDHHEVKFENKKMI